MINSYHSILISYIRLRWYFVLQIEDLFMPIYTLPCTHLASTLILGHFDLPLPEESLSFSLVDFLLLLGDFLLLLGVDQVKRVLSVVDFLEMTIVTNQS